MNSTYKTRYFNYIHYVDNLHSLCKSSANVEKIKAEYDFYYALPEHLQRYFVQPYNYEEADGTAKYNLEKFFMEDAAKQFLSGLIDHESYDNLMSRIARFLGECTPIEASKEEVIEEGRRLVVEKSKTRLAQLEADPRWASSPHRELLRERGLTPESIVSRLEKAYDFFHIDRTTWVKKISHGDLCFSNILWSNETQTLKLIDPKGVESLYLDEYYDIAKLSHSIVGNYDDIVYGNYRINYVDFDLNITRREDEYYWDTFYEWVKNLGLSFELQRVYEASIFVSMVPNHAEDDSRVAAFLIRAHRILQTLGQ